ncbi:MAG: hypothetical protein Tsb0013_03910 [Phycisphaerales bacterium]
MKKLLTTGALLALTGAASASFTFPSFDVTGISDNMWAGIDLTTLAAVPAGTYEQATITLTWNDDTPGTSSFSNGWANEARVSFASTLGSGSLTEPDTGAGTIYAPATSGDGAGNDLGPQSLTFNVPLITNYTSGPLFFNYRQTFDGANIIDWTNISITLGEAPPPQFLADFVIGTLMDGDQVTGDTRNSTNDFISVDGDPFVQSGPETGGDDIYELIWGGGDFDAYLNFEAGKDLDLFLYDANDTYLARAYTTDNPENLSVANLPAGTYYLRVDGFLGDNSAYTLTIPAPGSVALLGLAGLAGVRRRRA